MWFKNLRIYRITDALSCEFTELDTLLASSSFVPCSKSDTSRIGWVPPLGASGTMLVHSTQDFHLLRARTQQKLLPGPAIAEALDEKILEEERREGRKLHRRERTRLKDDIIQTLLPRALTRSHHTFAMIAAKRNLLLVDAAAPARAEELLNLLRSSLGRLPVKPLTPQHSPLELMTRWLAGGKMPGRFRLGQHCDLRDSLHAANVVRCRQQELAVTEVRAHLTAGKQAMALGLQWRERLNFVLHEDMSLRALGFADIAKNDPGTDQELDEAARFDADFALMALELDRLAEDLINVFGSTEK
jgi:recombination associated protein RdgC